MLVCTCTRGHDGVDYKLASWMCLLSLQTAGAAVKGSYMPLIAGARCRRAMDAVAAVRPAQTGHGIRTEVHQERCIQTAFLRALGMAAALRVVDNLCLFVDELCVAHLEETPARVSEPSTFSDSIPL